MDTVDPMQGYRPGPEMMVGAGGPLVFCLETLAIKTRHRHLDRRLVRAKEEGRKHPRLEAEHKVLAHLLFSCAFTVVDSKRRVGNMYDPADKSVKEQRAVAKAMRWFQQIHPDGYQFLKERGF